MHRPFHRSLLQCTDQQHRNRTARAIVREHDPDLIALIEMSERWSDALGLFRDFHSYEVLREDNYGLALYSRYPLKPPLEGGVGEGPPLYLGGVEVPQFGPLTVALLHAMPPASMFAYRTNRLMLRRLAGFLKDNADDAIVAGDFNATPFSPFYAVFLQGSEMRSAAEGFGFLPTWNATLPLVRLPLDHVMVKGRVRVVNYRVLDSINSDHFPLLVELLLCTQEG